jgi:hypothetical protein
LLRLRPTHLLVGLLVILHAGAFCACRAEQLFAQARGSSQLAAAEMATRVSADDGPCSAADGDRGTGEVREQATACPGIQTAAPGVELSGIDSPCSASAALAGIVDLPDLVGHVADWPAHAPGVIDSRSLPLLI